MTAKWGSRARQSSPQPRMSPEERVAAAALHPEIGTFDKLQEGAAVVRARLET